MRISSLPVFALAMVLIKTAVVVQTITVGRENPDPALSAYLITVHRQSYRSLSLSKRALQSIGTEGSSPLNKAYAAVRSASQNVKDRAEQVHEMIVPALRHHLEALARAEVPERLKSWRVFQDGGKIREGIRKSNMAFVRHLDKVRQPSQEYRYMRKKWRYEPDLRRHYFFPRILRVPIITQESELPFDKEVENFTKGNDDEFGHRSLVLAHLPLYADRFAEKTDTIVVPTGQEVEATLNSPDSHGKLGSSGPNEEGAVKPVTPLVRTPRHTPHGSGIFFPSVGEMESTGSAAATSNMQPPFQDLSQSDLSAELEKQSQTSSQKRRTRGSDAMEVALKFHNTLMDMRHRYNGFLDYQRSQIHKASLRYRGHPEYEPELDPDLGETLYPGVGRDAVAQRQGGDQVVSSRSRPVSPQMGSGGIEALSPQQAGAKQILPGTRSPRLRGQRVFSISVGRYPKNYADVLFGSYRATDSPDSETPFYKLGDNVAPPFRSPIRPPPTNTGSQSRMKKVPMHPPTPPSSPELWVVQKGSLHSTASRTNEDLDGTSDGFISTPPRSGTRGSGFRHFANMIDPVSIPDSLQRTSSSLSFAPSEERAPSLPRQPSDGRLSRISSAASFAFRPSIPIADHPTPRMPPSTFPLLSDDHLDTASTLVDRKVDADGPIFEKVHAEADNEAHVDQGRLSRLEPGVDKVTFATSSKSE